MDKKEFLQRSMIEIGAALVKCFDEGTDGIIGEAKQQDLLAAEAEYISRKLLRRAEGLGLFD